MRAVLFRAFGPPTVLELAEHHLKPSRRKGELLVEVSCLLLRRRMQGRGGVQGRDEAGLAWALPHEMHTPPGVLRGGADLGQQTISLPCRSTLRV